MNSSFQFPQSPRSSVGDDNTNTPFSPLHSPLSPATPSVNSRHRKSSLVSRSGASSIGGKHRLESPSEQVLAERLLDDSKQYVKSLLHNVHNAKRDDSIRALRSIKRRLPELKQSIESFRTPTTPDSEPLRSNFVHFEGKIMSVTNSVRSGLDRLKGIRSQMDLEMKMVQNDKVKENLVKYNSNLSDTIQHLDEKLEIMQQQKEDVEKELEDTLAHNHRLDSLLLRTLKREEMTRRKYRNKMNDVKIDQEKMEARLRELFDFSDVASKEEFLFVLDDTKDIRKRLLQRRRRKENNTLLSFVNDDDPSSVAASRKHSDDCSDVFSHGEFMPESLECEELDYLLHEQHTVSSALQKDYAKHFESVSQKYGKMPHEKENVQKLRVDATAEKDSSDSNVQKEQHSKGPLLQVQERQMHQRSRSNSLPVTFKSNNRDATFNPRNSTDSTEPFDDDSHGPMYNGKNQKLFEKFLKWKREFSEIDEDVSQLYKKLGLRDEDILPENDEAVDTSDLMHGKEVAVQVQQEDWDQVESSIESTGRQRTPDVVGTSHEISHDLNGSIHFNNGSSNTSIPQHDATSNNLSSLDCLHRMKEDPLFQVEMVRLLQNNFPGLFQDQKSGKRKASTGLPKVKRKGSTEKGKIEHQRFVQGHVKANPHLFEEAKQTRILNNGNAELIKRQTAKTRDFSNTEGLQVMNERINAVRQQYNDDIQWKKTVRYRVREDLLKSAVRSGKARCKSKPKNKSAISYQSKVIDIIHDKDNSFVSAQKLLSLRNTLPHGNLSSQSPKLSRF